MQSAPKPKRPARVATASLPWTPCEASGVDRKPILPTSERETGAAEIWLVRLAPGASLPLPADNGTYARCQEVLVVEGTWTVDGSDLGPYSYSRRPAQVAGPNATSGGCTLLVRNVELDERETEIVHIPFAADSWLPGQGNLGVRPLFNSGAEGTALVHWPDSERFLPHQHWGGEEIFVLSGTFRDEHGDYAAGTWIQSPHLSTHHPFVVEETIIFVKTGHLPQGD